MTDIQEVVNGLLQELRRGTIIIGVLSQLSEPQYGYSLVMILEEKGMSIDPGTLYPLLRRLEKQGLLDSEWDTTESRPRKYYRRSEFGTEVYRRLSAEWRELNHSVEGLLDLS
ncbi:PadR family transcriptional regulator [Paenibacillus woosongensis]|uniref:PadR family transcriptional regulator n=1 Tax=Paenibacillus woosongensis TaxID=307580 RepID=A0AA95I9D0_9BACL|nr:PadR family transcriptional regulator [Paenibacillus woosongensis]WHX48917.1 PadR family transcriptional regulator [Paenibacillus woosongensis]